MAVKNRSRRRPDRCAACPLRARDLVVTGVINRREPTLSRRLYGLALEGLSVDGRPVRAGVFDEHAVRAAAGITMVLGAVAFAQALLAREYLPIQLVTVSYRLPLTPDDVVLVSLLDHHSNDLPWRAVPRCITSAPPPTAGSTKTTSTACSRATPAA